MRINGKEIRDRIKADLRKEVASLDKPINLAIVMAGENPVVRGFVNIKKKFAEDIGVSVFMENFPVDVSFFELAKTLEKLRDDEEVAGIIVQLPLPHHLDTDKILNLIPVSKDVDVLAGASFSNFKKGTLLPIPPVIGAIKEICEETHVEIHGKKVLVIGHGRLVGMPAAVWFKEQGGEVTVLDRPTLALEDFTKKADIIVSGAGVAGLLRPEILKDGVVLLDAGTSEEGGVIVGDADLRCEEVASVSTPVPGGIGPVTVAMIFKNLINLVKSEQIDFYSKKR